MEKVEQHRASFTETTKDGEISEEKFLLIQAPLPSDGLSSAMMTYYVFTTSALRNYPVHTMHPGILTYLVATTAVNTQAREILHSKLQCSSVFYEFVHQLLPVPSIK